MAILTFGEFRLDTENKRLWRKDRPVELGGTPLAALCHLVQHSLDGGVDGERIVTKRELRELIWGGVHVTDETVRGCVSAIRRALGDDSQKPRYIETHNRQGWRFLMKVHCVEGDPIPRERAPQPPNGPYDATWYVERPQLEREILGCIEYPGRPVIVYGPQGSGKSTLTSRVLDAARSAQPEGAAHVVRINLRAFSDGDLRSIDSMLCELGRRMLDPNEEAAVRTAEILASAWTPGVDAKVNLKKLVRSHLLTPGKTVYLVLSDVEALAPWPHQTVFFDMLRAWQDATGLGALRLIMESAIPPRLFPLGGSSPLWTKTRRIEVKGLDPHEISKLAALYGLRPSLNACTHLGELVGGLAGLCRHALYQAALAGTTLEAVLRDYQADRRGFGPFREHLEDLQEWLERQAQPAGTSASLELLREAVRGIPLDHATAWPLVRKGLVLETEARGIYTLRCKLYADFVAERAA